MENAKVRISVIIVNYKVKEYILNLLNSLKKAQHNFDLEIFVVDNASEDNSVAYLAQRFPEVTYISNNENIGFARANNKAIQRATGQFTLIINPDTLISEDTFEVLINHMEKNPKCGAAGCKILNPDGSFARECRRSVPDLKAAIFRVIGADYIFPKSKLFGKRYLGWLPEDEVAEVPVISGAFMFWRTPLLKSLDGFDEDFFMYCEDDDLCYRLQDTPYRIDYVPNTSIIHYKGESAKKNDLRHISVFNKALYKFFKKHYGTQYSLFFRALIYTAVWLKMVISVTLKVMKKIKHVFADLIILNISVVIGFGLRFALKNTNIFSPEGVKYLWINALISVLYLMSGSVLGMLRGQSKSASTSIKSLTATYIGVVVVTFFVRDLAFSRLALIFGYIAGVIMFFGYKLYQANKADVTGHKTGKIKNSKVLIVSDSDKSADIISKIHNRPDWSYEIVGRVSTQVGDEESLGSITQLKDLVRAYNIDQVFFALNSISYKQMLKEISSLQKEDVIFKLIPDSLDFILGKSNVEYLESIPLVEIDLEYSKPLNIFLKRSFDLILALPLFIGMLLVVWPSLLFSNQQYFSVDGMKFYRDATKNKWKNRLRLLGYVISGKLSLVGAPLSYFVIKRSSLIKRGLTGLVQINENRIQQQEEEENFSLYYMQNFSLWMDIDIIIKTIFNGPYPLEVLARQEKKED